MTWFPYLPVFSSNLVIVSWNGNLLSVSAYLSFVSATNALKKEWREEKESMTKLEKELERKNLKKKTIWTNE